MKLFFLYFQNKLLKPYKPNDLKQNISEFLDLKHEETETPEAVENGKLKSEYYDLSDIYEFSGHDDDAMQTIMQAFLEGATSSTKELEVAFQEKDSDKMGKLAEYFNNWRLAMTSLAEADNVICKLSGLGMCDWNWTVDSIRPWVLECIEIFGPDRCLFATNWPVDRLFSTYEDVVDAYTKIIESFTYDEKQSMFSRNAEELYNL